MGYPEVRLRRLRSTPAIRSLFEEHPVLPERMMLTVDIDEQETSITKLFEEASAAAISCFNLTSERNLSATAEFLDSCSDWILRIRKICSESVVCVDLSDYSAPETDQDVVRGVFNLCSNANLILLLPGIPELIYSYRTRLNKAGFESIIIAADFNCFPLQDLQSAQHPAAIASKIKDVAEQGADIISLTPAFGALDVISAIVEQLHLPVVLRHSSLEYASIRTSAQQGYFEERELLYELYGSAFRAGAHLIATPAALHVFGSQAKPHTL